MPNSHSLRLDSWLSETLGKASYELEMVGASTDSTARWATIDFANVQNPAFIFARVSPGDPSLPKELAQKGFFLIETNVLLGITLSKEGAPNLGHPVRMSKSSDEAAVRTVAETSFRVSRFHRDPEFPIGVADELNAIWAANFFKGKRGDQMLVAEYNGEVAGFLTLLVKEDENRAVIDLLAVSPKARRAGLASQLVNGAIALMTPLVKELHVGTQLENGVAMAFYQRRGFRVIDAKYVFHMHLSERNQ